MLKRPSALSCLSRRLHCSRLRASLFALVTLFAPSVAFSQGQLLGAIHGTVKDQQGGVLPGTLITATPTESRPPITATANASGYYILQGLQPGEYQISADLSGFSRLVQPGVVARAGITLSVDVVMTVGNVDELITVRRETPLLDTSSPTTAVNISGDLQRAIPTSRRQNWSDALALTPGVVSVGAPFGVGGLTENYMVHGASITSNVLQVDGVDIASSKGSQTSYIAFNTDTIADVQVKTAGVDASTPLGTGAVLNITTKSGTNNLGGAVSTIWQPLQWNSSNVPDGTAPTLRVVQPDVSLGGPILRDRMWFYASYRRMQGANGLTRSAAQLDVLSKVNPDFQPFDLQNRGDIYFLKADTRISPNHRVSGFFQSDKNTSESAQAVSSAPVTSRVGGHAGALRLSSVIGSATHELGVSYNKKSFAPVRVEIAEPVQQVFRQVVMSSGRLVGQEVLAQMGSPTPNWADQPADKVTLSYDLSYVLPRRLGNHTVKTGLFLQPRLYQASTAYQVNDGFSVEQLVLTDPLNPASPTRAYRRWYYPSSFEQYRSTGSDYAFYLQDLWQVGRLTATIGVRVDRIQYDDEIFNITTQKSVEVGPRIGLNYALRSDHRGVARFTFNRVHDRVTGAATAGTVSPTITSQYDLNLDGVFETTDVAPGNFTLPGNRIYDTALHQPYINEWTGGYRHQFDGELTLDAGVVRRTTEGTFALLETNQLYDGNVFIGYRDETIREVYQLTNNKWNQPVYTALVLTASKRSGRLSVLAGYTRQWRHLNGTWQPHDPASFISPDAFPNHRGIGVSTGSLSGTVNSLSGGTGDNAAWRDHLLRLGMTLQVPGGMSLAASYVYNSGVWSGPIVRNAAAPDPAFGPPTVRLSTGVVVPNPLATIVRFAYPTRGEGQFRLEGQHTLNVRIGKTFDLTRGMKLALTADVFNVTNDDADLGLMSGGNRIDGPNFGLGGGRPVPRGAQLGARLSF